jgi:hypothetical protein
LSYQIKAIMARIKVRFNLGKGANFMKWKVQYPNGKIEYYSPTDTQLMMSGCQLKNHKKTAQKIFNGGEKVVCAWVLCDNLNINTDTFAKLDLFCAKLKYNPRVQPNWLMNDKIVDNEFIELIGTVDYGLYKIS